jgi:hypothetical protein
MRKPKDIDAEIKAIQDKARSLKARRKTQLGELVEATGADELSLEALAGLLIGAVEQAKKDPASLARWTERGATFFRGDRGRRERADGAAQPPGGSADHRTPAAPAGDAHGPPPGP